MNYLVLKLTPERMMRHLLSQEDLITVLSNNWRITQRKTKNVTRAIVLYQGTIIREYEIQKQSFIGELMTFDLRDIGHTNKIGKTISYPTSNPASIIHEDNLKNLLEEA